MNGSRLSAASLVVAVLFAMVGCGGGGPQAYPVTGKVTQKGQPVAGAVVAFVAVTSGEPGGQAETGADGTFAMQSTADQGRTTLPGLPAGEYKVTVMKMQAGAGEVSLANPPRNILPPEYAMVESTPVTATVTAEGPNEVTIPL